MKAKRFITEYNGARAVDRIDYDGWAKQVNFYSYFAPVDVVEQIEQFFPESIEVIQ